MGDATTKIDSSESNAESTSDKNSSITRTPSTGYPTSTPVHTQQPGMTPSRGALILMPAPALIPGIPPGLEYLAAVDGISINQITRRRICSKSIYVLCNQAGQQVFHAAGRRRPFLMCIMNASDQPVIMVRGPVGGFLTFGHSGINECVVECPPGTPIGKVFNSRRCCHKEFVVLVAGRIMFKIEGESCGGEYQHYQIVDVNGMAQIGSIYKNYNGMFREYTMVVRFPMNLDVISKALLLGATFFFDYVAIVERERQQAAAAHHG